MRGQAIPWTVRPLSEIPLPPFVSTEESARFHSALGLYIAELARAVGGPSPETIALAAIVHAESETARRAGTFRQLSATVLGIAISSYFPAPWTHESLVVAAAKSLPGYDNGWLRAAQASVVHLGDPEMRAKRAGDGSWLVAFVERGVARVDADLANDWELVLYLMHYLGRRLPYPYGWKVDEALRQRVSAQAERVAAMWSIEAEMPYLSSWSSARPA